MKSMTQATVLLLLIAALFMLFGCNGASDEDRADYGAVTANEEARHIASNTSSNTLPTTGQPSGTYILPAPRTDGEMSVEQALAARRSRRNFQDRAMTTEQLSQILWAAYGITQPRPDAPNLRGGLRTTPSAGALFPLEIYVVVGNVEGIEPGVYRYISQEHKIVRVLSGDIRSELSGAALGQGSVRDAPVVLVHSAVFERMLGRYGERGIIYTYIEVGHSAQNVYLQAEALGLGTVAVGAFVDETVRQVLSLPENEVPLYLMPIGYFYGD